MIRVNRVEVSQEPKLQQPQSQHAVVKKNHGLVTKGHLRDEVVADAVIHVARAVIGTTIPVENLPLGKNAALVSQVLVKR